MTEVTEMLMWAFLVSWYYVGSEKVPEIFLSSNMLLTSII